MNIHSMRLNKTGFLETVYLIIEIRGIDQTSNFLAYVTNTSSRLGGICSMWKL